MKCNYWELKYEGYGTCVFESRQKAREEKRSIKAEEPSAKIKIRRIKMSIREYERLEEFGGW